MTEEVVNKMADEPTPTEQSVGNHHWPSITNIYEAHGNAFPDHHNHVFAAGGPLGPVALRFVHQHANLAAHDASARMHMPENRDGCRGKM